MCIDLLHGESDINHNTFKSYMKEIEGNCGQFATVTSPWRSLRGKLA